MKLKLSDKIKTFKNGLTHGLKSGLCKGYQSGFFAGGLILCLIFSFAGILTMEKEPLPFIGLLIIIIIWFIMAAYGCLYWGDRHDIDKIAEVCKRLSDKGISPYAQHFEEELKKELKK